MKRIFLFILPLLIILPVFSQEALKSYEENYYDMLSLTGITKRNYLNYRGLYNSIWNIEDSSSLPWESKNLGTSFSFSPFDKASNWFLNGINQSLDCKIYALDNFNSYNTKAPFGQNDGSLWQGRGYNTSISSGLYFKAYGLEVTLKPQFTFSQNLYFDIIPVKPDSNYTQYIYWSGKIDAIQRFGETAFNNFDWGDSEVRYSFYNFTIGYGTQPVWLGPSEINALLLSNNAATFPKFDIGIYRTSLYVPYFKWYLGDFEVHSWVGKLKESDYFDYNYSNNYNQYSGFSISWAPPYLTGLTFGFNKVCICKWGDSNWIYYLNPLFSGNTIHPDTENGEYGEDQKASLTIDWLLESSGFEFYTEIGVDDFLSKGLVFYEYARYPFHTMAYTVGIKKSLQFSKKKNLYGLINFEWNNTEGSKDYNNWPGVVPNFGSHYQIKQGYTNKGQWLGSGIGYGGNSQYLSFTLYSPHGYDKIFGGRNNPDNNYVDYKINTGVSGSERSSRWFTAYKANFYVGAESMWFIHKDLSVTGGMIYDLIINPLYNPGKSSNGTYREYNYWNNFQFNLRIKYTL